MKIRVIVLGMILLVLSFASIVGATVYTFSPSDPDMWNLNHKWAFYWGIDFSLPSGEEITSASLTFNKIYNWNDDPNVLYTHLLPAVSTSPSDISRVMDNPLDILNGDYFAGQGTLLWTLTNLQGPPPPVAPTLTHKFTSAEMDILQEYMDDGNFGFGLDPDCEFYNKGIVLTINTPEPSTLILLGSGLIGAVIYTRRRK